MIGAWFDAADVVEACGNTLELDDAAWNRTDKDRALQISSFASQVLSLAPDARVFLSAEEFFALRKQWPPLRGEYDDVKPNQDL